MNKLILGSVSLLLGLVSIVAGTLAALEETVKVTGAAFNIASTVGETTEPPSGNTALKIYKNVAGTSADTNLADAMPAPTFNNITAAWHDVIPVKLYNKGTKIMDIVSRVDYISDPHTLRDDIKATVVEWNDSNNNGSIDAGEEGQTYGSDTLLRWRNDTFVLGQINPLQTKAFVLKFDGTELSEANANQSAVYDFVFTGVQQP